MGRHATEPSRAGWSPARWVPLAVAGVLVAAAVTVAVVKFGPDPLPGSPGGSAVNVLGSSSAVNSSAGSSSTSSSSSTTSSSEPSTSTGTSTPATTTTSAPPLDPCPERAVVRIAAASGITPVLQEVAQQACADLQITTTDGTSGATLLATGQVDAWIPDSRENAFVLNPDLAATAPSMAVSPVVLASTPETVTALSGAGPVSWGIMLSPQAMAPLTFEMPSSAGSGAAMAVTGNLIQAATAVTGDKYLGLAAVASATTGIATLPPETMSTPIAADRIRLVEARQLTAPDGSSLGAALPLLEGVPALDYPWMMPTTPADPAVAAAADRLVATLAGPAGTTSRAGHGFAEPASATVAVGAGTATVLPQIPSAEVRNLLGLMGTGLRPGNTLAVLDVSGSMGDLMDGATVTPMEGVRASAALMLGMLQDNTSLALWEFGEQLAPPNDYQELVPSAPLAANRQALLELLPTIQARPSGTALYSTVLGAYQSLQAQYNPEATNLLAIFTDGRNQDVVSMDLAALLTQLQAVVDPARPIGVLFFGYGDVDLDAMQQISAVTGGGVWSINTPEQIIGAFIEATGQTAVFA